MRPPLRGVFHMEHNRDLVASLGVLGEPGLAHKQATARSHPHAGFLQELSRTRVRCRLTGIHMPAGQIAVSAFEIAAHENSIAPYQEASGDQLDVAGAGHEWGG